MTFFQTVSKWSKTPLLLWMAVMTAWFFSVFSVIQEFCLVSACRDAAGFALFGINMGWFGIAYFSIMLMFLLYRKKYQALDLLLSVAVFAGIGAELRLLWIQKYVIGAWCPLCVTICCALCVATVLLIVEKSSGGAGRGAITGWIALMVMMVIAGLAAAVLGVHVLP